MNSIATLAAIYWLMTLCSASILYLSFKKRLDISGRYFLLAELSVLPAMVSVILINLNKSYAIPVSFFTINIFSWVSQISVLFSIYALTSNTQDKKYVWAVSSGIIYAGLIEVCREENATLQTITLISSVSEVIFAFWTYAICKSIQDNQLKDNHFFSWIKYIQLALGLFALIRIASCLTNMPINTRNPSLATTLFYVVFVTLNIFRYISYQSLRISWVDPRGNQTNPLNRNLAQAFEEKDKLLLGLIASNRVLGISALASSLAHQLSQPLTAIGLQTETLKRDLIKSGKDEKTVAALNKMSLQLGKLSALVKNLRQLFNARNYTFDKVRLQTITDELLEIIEPTLKAKKIHFTKTFNSNPVVLGDAIQIQQVLINLFNNAIDAIANDNSSRREIKLTIVSDHQFASISIEDTGTGIDPNLLPTIFELYKTTKAEGLGVGLWLSKTIMDKHHGRISASNSADGGAIFTVQIPLAEKKP